MALTEVKLRALRFNPRPGKTADKNGLFIKIDKAGRMYWRSRLRRDGRDTEQSYGPYPEVTLAEARERHMEDWAAFLRAHSLEHSMSRRGNCHDNAVAESLFNLLKRERIRRRTYKTRVEARQDVFDYIEMFYNPKRKHVRNGMLSPVEFERQQEMRTEGV